MSTYRRKPTRAPRGMTRDAALQLLELKSSVYDVATIKAAFARKCRESHPDTRVGRGPLEFVYIGRFQEARDVLLEAAAGLNRACKLCRGTGKVRGRVGVQNCSACAGTGDKQ